MNTQNKSVYFAAAVRGDRSLSLVVAELINFIKSRGVLVLSEHIASGDPVADFAGKVGKSKDDLTSEDIEKQDIAWLDQANYVVAEISGASTGTGREIEYARNKHFFGKTPAKILCLFRKDKKQTASAMICGMTQERYPNVLVKSYQDVEQAKALISDFLEL